MHLDHRTFSLRSDDTSEIIIKKHIHATTPKQKRKQTYIFSLFIITRDGIIASLGFLLWTNGK